jgi:hypothetical protein
VDEAAIRRELLDQVEMIPVRPTRIPGGYLAARKPGFYPVTAATGQASAGGLANLGKSGLWPEDQTLGTGATRPGRLGSGSARDARQGCRRRVSQ